MSVRTSVASWPSPRPCTTDCPPRSWALCTIRTRACTPPVRDSVRRRPTCWLAPGSAVGPGSAESRPSARQYLGHHADAEDMLQDAWLRWRLLGATSRPRCSSDGDAPRAAAWARHIGDPSQGRRSPRPRVRRPSSTRAAARLPARHHRCRYTGASRLTLSISFIPSNVPSQYWRGWNTAEPKRTRRFAYCPSAADRADAAHVGRSRTAGETHVTFGLVTSRRAGPSEVSSCRQRQRSPPGMPAISSPAK